MVVIWHGSAIIEIKKTHKKQIFIFINMTINKKVELNSNKFDWFDLFIYYYFYDVKIYCFLCIFLCSIIALTLHRQIPSSMF